MFTLLIHHCSHTVQREYGTLDRALSAAQAALEQATPFSSCPPHHPRDMTKRRKTYRPGYAPANVTAWCAYHDRGCNDKYLRSKHCLTKNHGLPCRHLRVLPIDHTP